MNARAGTPRARHLNWRLLSVLIAGAGLALLVAANAHLVYVAVQSQPDCVPHLKTSGDGDTFRAARSAC